MKGKSSKGFTLLELLIVVVIIAILAAVAVPQFGKSIKKSRSAEAIATISAYLNSAYAYYLEKNTFDAAGVKSNYLVTEPSGGLFTYSVAAAAGIGTNGVTFTATGSGNASGVTVIGTVYSDGKKDPVTVTVS